MSRARASLLPASVLVLIALGFAGLACHGQATQAFDDGGASVEPSAATVALTEAGPAPAPDRSVLVGRDSPRAPSEVELDPRGEVVIALDPIGQVRLWPAIRSGEPAQTQPWTVPIQEPLWMSVAQRPGATAGEPTSYAIAVVDTTNTGRVYALAPEPAQAASAEPSQARFAPLFALSPEDPLLELHALDGGERFVALGVDHRVRVYDRDGRELSAIDERGFAPWQLRVVPGDAPGAAPKLAAVLAAPVRVQALALEGDRLTRLGEPLPVALDRGPNRGDLVLSPDGRTVAALRRKSGRGREFSVELIDLLDGGRRLLAGRSDASIRPRMHFVDAERILLETGSARGTGLWLDTRAAVALETPADAEPDSKLAARLAKAAELASVALPASAEHRPEHFDPEFDSPWDHGARFHASVVAGVRVNVGPRNDPAAMVVDELDGDAHLSVRLHSRWHVERVLDTRGEHRASVDDTHLRVTAVTDTTDATTTTIEHGMTHVFEVVFVDDDRILLVDQRGRVRVFDWRRGQVVSETELDARWIDALAYHRTGPGAGVLGWKVGGDFHRLTVANGSLGAPVSLPDGELGKWVELLHRRSSVRDALFPERVEGHGVDEIAVTPAGRRLFTLSDPRTSLWVLDPDADQPWAIPLPAGQGRALSPSPTGTHVAIVQFRERDDGRGSDHLVSVVDLETGARLWTVGFDHGLLPPTWSGDGQRLVVAQQVRDALTGDPVGPAPTAELVIDATPS